MQQQLFTVALDAQAWDIILNAVAFRPWREADLIIKELHSQIQAQMMAAPQADEPVSKEMELVMNKKGEIKNEPVK